jgi:hypothetical protein
LYFSSPSGEGRAIGIIRKTKKGGKQRRVVGRIY